MSSARGGSPRRLGPAPGVPSIRACRVWRLESNAGVVTVSLAFWRRVIRAVEQTRDRGGAAPRWCGVNQTPIQPRPDRSVAGRPTDTLEERAHIHTISFPGRGRIAFSAGV